MFLRTTIFTIAVLFGFIIQQKPMAQGRMEPGNKPLPASYILTEIKAELAGNEQVLTKFLENITWHSAGWIIQHNAGSVIVGTGGAWITSILSNIGTVGGSSHNQAVIYPEVVYKEKILGVPTIKVGESVGLACLSSPDSTFQLPSSLKVEKLATGAGGQEKWILTRHFNLDPRPQVNRWSNYLIAIDEPFYASTEGLYRVFCGDERMSEARFSVTSSPDLTPEPKSQIRKLAKLPDWVHEILDSVSRSSNREALKRELIERQIMEMKPDLQINNLNGYDVQITIYNLLGDRHLQGNRSLKLGSLSAYSSKTFKSMPGMALGFKCELPHVLTVQPLNDDRVENLQKYKIVVPCQSDRDFTPKVFTIEKIPLASGGAKSFLISDIVGRQDASEQPIEQIYLYSHLKAEFDARVIYLLMANKLESKNIGVARKKVKLSPDEREPSGEIKSKIFKHNPEKDYYLITSKKVGLQESHYILEQKGKSQKRFEVWIKIPEECVTIPNKARKVILKNQCRIMASFKDR